MARIRSVHPGIFTDEAAMELSHAAFRLFIGLLTECDDQGVFEWKPVTLKARILPAHNEDVTALLGELAAHNFIARFEHGGKAYGAVRNFLKYQRPRRPTAVHPLPAELAPYVGKEVSSTAPIPDNVGNDDASTPPIPDIVGKVSADGGWRMEDGEEDGGKKKNKYRFAGEVVRLNARDYDRWRKAYSAIPDFDAELQRIDDQFRAKPPENWFIAASAMLAAKHQKLSAQAANAPPRRPASTVIPPLGVGG